MSTPLNVGYLVPAFPGQTHAFFWRESLGLRERGVTTRFFSTRRPPAAACRHAFAAEATAATHYTYPPRLPAVLALLLARPGAALRALLYVARLRESGPAGRLRALGLLLAAADMAWACRRVPLDHLHAHSCADAAHVAALFALLTGTPYSLALHGGLAVYGRDHVAKMQRAAFVAVDTLPLRREVADQVGLPPERLPVIKMGVDVESYPGRSERAGARPGRLHLVTVARLDLCKGHVYALEALARLKAQGIELLYTIVGDGVDRGSIEADVDRLDLRAQVEFPGTLGEHEVRALLGRADAFALTSIGPGEAAPVSVMEAMACGLPVVCSIIGGTPELIAHEVDGLLVKQGDVDGISAALQALARDPGLRLRLGQAARAKAEAAFGYRVGAARLHEQVLAHRGARWAVAALSLVSVGPFS
jgi:glycosyltransferase involved in cell wall biosynthesis